MTMDFSNSGFSRIEGAYRHYQDPGCNQRTLMIEIVVVDMTCPGKTAYQLNHEKKYSEDELKLIKQGVIAIPHDAFTPIGDVKSINKQSKVITLADNNIITYNHLITVSGKQATLLSYEFIAGLYALIDALRLNNTVSNLASPLPEQFQLKASITHQESNNSNIEKLGNHALPTKRPEEATVLVSEFNKKLFQVHI